MMDRTPTPQPPARTSRRELLRGLGRAAGAAALAAAAIILGRRAAARADETCDRDGACRGCERLDDCLLPRGQSARGVLRP